MANIIIDYDENNNIFFEYKSDSLNFRIDSIIIQSSDEIALFDSILPKPVISDVRCFDKITYYFFVNIKKSSNWYFGKVNFFSAIDSIAEFLFKKKFRNKIKIKS